MSTLTDGTAQRRKPKRQPIPAGPQPAAPDFVRRDEDMLASDRVEVSDEGPIQVLTLFLDGGEYAIPILHVWEIASYRSVTPVPTTPPWIRGVMNLRGTVVPVIDLRAKLGLGSVAVTSRTCLVIVGIEREKQAVVMAVAVDGVSRVIDLSSEDLQDAPSFGTSVDVTFIKGLVQIDGRLVLLLDLGRVLSSAEVLDLRSEALRAALEGQMEAGA